MWPALTISCSVYSNTKLLQIHFPKAMYISTTFYLSTHCWKISLIWNFPPDFGEKLLLSPDFLDWKKFS